jgi:hypothetical protein
MIKMNGNNRLFAHDRKAELRFRLAIKKAIKHSTDYPLRIENDKQMESVAINWLIKKIRPS